MGHSRIFQRALRAAEVQEECKGLLVILLWIDGVPQHQHASASDATTFKDEGSAESCLERKILFLHKRRSRGG